MERGRIGYLVRALNELASLMSVRRRPVQVKAMAQKPPIRRKGSKHPIGTKRKCGTSTST
jgi:hypothetical protein